MLYIYIYIYIYIYVSILNCDCIVCGAVPSYAVPVKSSMW